MEALSERDRISQLAAGQAVLVNAYSGKDTLAKIYAGRLVTHGGASGVRSDGMT